MRLKSSSIEAPETVGVKPLRGGEAFAVRRGTVVDGMDADPEQLRQASAENAEHDSYKRALYRSLKPTFSEHFMSRRTFRPSLVYHETVEAVTTDVGTTVEETLGYALTLRGAGQSIVVINGLARIGKTFAVKQRMARHPGEARYAQVPSSNDDMSFFRAIGAALGIGGGRTAKAHELRDKIEDVLQRGDLMLVLDEGHHLWPQRNMRRVTPHRITWIMTQLANMGVPVAIVTTPQFTKSQEALTKHGGWSSEQFIGRIADYKRLPECLSESDLRAVVCAFFPRGDTRKTQK